MTTWTDIESAKRHARDVRQRYLEERQWNYVRINNRMFWKKQYGDTTFTVSDPDSAVEIQKDIDDAPTNPQNG